jgi:hypothetical protein
LFLNSREDRRTREFIAYKLSLRQREIVTVLLGGGKLRERHDGNSGRRVAAALSELAQELKQQRSNQGKPRKSRERKQRKPLKRQQPERKGKYRERQCRANRKQHHKLSKLSARHDTQRAGSWFWLGGYSRVSQPLF